MVALRRSDGTSTRGSSFTVRQCHILEAEKCFFTSNSVHDDGDKGYRSHTRACRCQPFGLMVSLLTAALENITMICGLIREGRRDE